MAFSSFRPKHKYGAKKTAGSSLTDGRSFGSQLERGVYLLLKAMEQNDEIVVEACQDQVELSAARIVYKPDFRIFDKRIDQQVWCEAKGFETPEWRIKRRLWIAYGPGLLRIYKGSGTRIRLHEELKGGGA
jgi:predicted nuclease of restriction endonuclease-like RecB superfamily